MTLPKTAKGWVQLTAATVALLVSLGSAAYAVSTTVATKEDVRRVEEAAVASINTLRCDLLDSAINELTRKREAEGLSARERARLDQLLREWNRVCTDGSS